MTCSLVVSTVFESDSHVIAALAVGPIPLALHAVGIFGVVVAEPAPEFLTIYLAQTPVLVVIRSAPAHDVVSTLHGGGPADPFQPVGAPLPVIWRA